MAAAVKETPEEVELASEMGECLGLSVEETPELLGRRSFLKTYALLCYSIPLSIEVSDSGLNFLNQYIQFYVSLSIHCIAYRLCR